MVYTQVVYIIKTLVLHYFTYRVSLTHVLRRYNPVPLPDQDFKM